MLIKITLLMIPVFSFVVFILRSNLFAIVIVFTMAFSQGIFGLFGIPSIVPRLIAELSIIVLLAKSLFLKPTNTKKLVSFGLLPMTGLFLVTVFSFYINNMPILNFVLFFRHMFIFYFFLLALLNLKISQRTVSIINRYLVFLFLIQILANLIKFAVVGQTEGYGIGTMSVHGGSLTTTFALSAIAFSFAFYLFKKDKRYIIFMIGFFIFALIGNKRAIAFYIPILIPTIVYCYSKRQKNNKLLFIRSLNAKVIFLVIVFSWLGIYCTSRAITSLNPDNKFGGKFDIKYLKDKVTTYTVRTSSTGVQLGRWGATVQCYRSLKRAGLNQLLFGFGSGKMVTSLILSPQSLTEIGTVQFDIGYGFTGFVWVILQVGLLGVGFLVYFYFTMFKHAYKLYQNSTDQNYKAIGLGFLGINMVFSLDFFTYSKTTLTSGVLTPVYFYTAFIIFKSFIPKTQTVQRKTNSHNAEDFIHSIDIKTHGSD